MPAYIYKWDGTTWRGTDVPDITPIDPFVLGTTKPDAGNTGLYAPTTHTVTAADTTYSVNGQTISDTLFTGNINVTGQNVTFDNCEFRGKNTTTSNHAVRVNAASQSGAVFNRCKFVNQYYPADGSDGAHGAIMGHHFTATRCDISGACDGIGLAAVSGAVSGITIQGCYIHGQWFTSPNADHASDGNHCDGIQGHQFLSDVTIYGNTITGLVDDTLSGSEAGNSPTYSGGTLTGGSPWYTAYRDGDGTWQGFDYVPWGTSACLFGRSGTGGGLTNLNISSNWLNGGSYACINLNSGYTNSNSSGVTISNNRVGANNRDGYLLICASGLTVTFTGNTYENGGGSANTRRNG